MDYLDRFCEKDLVRVSEAIAKVEADANRSADTHLLRFPLPPSLGVDLYLKDDSVHPTGSLFDCLLPSQPRLVPARAESWLPRPVQRQRQSLCTPHQLTVQASCEHPTHTNARRPAESATANGRGPVGHFADQIESLSLEQAFHSTGDQ